MNGHKGKLEIRMCGMVCVRARNLSTSGTKLQEHKKIGQMLRKSEFRAFYGSLESFKMK
jgi:hypothetical protein